MLVFSPPQPAVGEVLQIERLAPLHAPALRPSDWRGVDLSLGDAAWWTPTAPGDYTVTAGGEAIVITVRPPRPAPAAPPRWDWSIEALPSGTFAPCDDGTPPTLAPPWVYGCGPSGVAPLAYNLDTRRTAPPAPPLGPLAPSPPIAGLLQRAAGPAGVLLHRRWLGAETLEWQAWGSPSRRQQAARLVPGQPVVVGERRAAWVARDVFGSPAVYVGEADSPAARWSGLGRGWWPASGGGWIGWVEEGAVVLQAEEGPARVRLPARTGFLGGIAVDGPAACWSARFFTGAGVGEGEREGDVEVDIVCSDAGRIVRPKAQRVIARRANLLLLREEGRLLIARLRAPAA